MTIFNALIRTHHITSKKKVARLRQAASGHGVLALLRSGGAPGIMYVEGHEPGVRAWVDAVHNLRYKDYHLAVKPAAVLREDDVAVSPVNTGSLVELATVKDFAEAMKERGVLTWWRRGMGFEGGSLL